jgi:CBS domain-containing protein
MYNDMLDDELSQMYEEVDRSAKVLDSTTFKKPIKHLRVRKPLQVALGTTVSDAVRLMNEKGMGCVLVTQKEKLAGILTERDVLKKVVGKLDPDKTKVQDVMTPDPQGFQPEDSIAFVLNAMHVGGYRHVPIVNEQKKPIAVVSVKDVVAFILDNFPEDVLNLPPEPMRKTEQREGA